MDVEQLSNIEAMWASEAERYRSGQWPSGFPAMPTIPTGRYWEQAFYDLECAHVFRRSWVFACHQSELPAKGHYIARMVGDVPVFVVRTEEGTFRAFHNMCMHRGARLLHDERGSVRQINCPYHCWTYGLDGALTFVPDKEDFPGLDFNARRLKEITCETYRGLIFIALQPPAETLADFLSGMKAALADVPLEGATLFRRVVIPADCNWKCVQDAFSETYHVRYVHANSVNQAINQRYTARYMLAGGHNAMLVRARQAEGSELVNVFDRAGAVGNQGDVKSALRPVTAISQRSYNVFPNLTVPIAENLFPILAIWPKGPNRCELELRMMKLPGGCGTPENDAAVTDAFCAIAQEDLSALSGMQSGLASGALPDLVLGYGEQFIANYQLELDARIGHEHIPPHLRIEPVSLPHHGSRVPADEGRASAS